MGRAVLAWKMEGGWFGVLGTGDRKGVGRREGRVVGPLGWAAEGEAWGGVGLRVGRVVGKGAV